MGRRIVDIFYVVDQIKRCIHEGGFMDMEFVHEKRFGHNLNSYVNYVKLICKFSLKKNVPETYLPIHLASISGSISLLSKLYHFKQLF